MVKVTVVVAAASLHGCVSLHLSVSISSAPRAWLAAPAAHQLIWDKLHT